nr:NIPA-like protein 2 isoform X7 [Manis javanica]
MAARAPEGPGDTASAALDELSRNFTYGALGVGNGSLSGAWYRRNQIHLFGVLLAILGNLVISISLNIQKYSHLRLVHQEHQRPFFRSVLWWGGILLMAVGETGNFAAYGFAPITLIAPLSCMSVTGSAIISVVFLKENLRASDLLDFRNTSFLHSPVFSQKKRNEAHCDSANPGGTSRYHILSGIPWSSFSHCIYLSFWVFSVIPWCVFGHKKSRKETSATVVH